MGHGKGLGSPEGSPSQTPNEFGAQNFVINHWLKPVAWIVDDKPKRKPCTDFEAGQGNWQGEITAETIGWNMKKRKDLAHQSFALKQFQKAEQNCQKHGLASAKGWSLFPPPHGKFLCHALPYKPKACCLD